MERDDQSGKKPTVSTLIQEAYGLTQALKRGDITANHAGAAARTFEATARLLEIRCRFGDVVL